MSDNTEERFKDGSEDMTMSLLINESVTVETAPSTLPIPAETIPADPNDPCGVNPSLIEEIEEIGRNNPGR